MKFLGASVACIFTVVIPFWYYLFSVSEIEHTLAIETAFTAKSLERVIQDRPEMWEFESVKLQEIISQAAIHGAPSERTVRNTAGTVIAKNSVKMPSPMVSRSIILFDSGQPVGSLEARQSTRTLILFTSLLGILSAFLGGLIYYIFRTYPIRKIDAALADLQRAEQEQRLSREAAERLAEETAVIAEIGRLIGSTLDIDEVYERFAAETRKLIPFDRISVNLFNMRENTVTVIYASGAEVAARNQRNTFPLEGTFSLEIRQKQAGILIQPESPEEIDRILHRMPALAPSFQTGMRSMIGVPLISRSQVFGTLHLRSGAPNTYTERHLRLAERIGGQIAGAITNAQLFTDLKHTEKSLRESEQRFRALIEQAAVGVAEIDVATGCFLTVNRRLCEMVGMTERELLATTFQAITHPEDASLHEEKSALLQAGGIGHYDLEKRYIRKDGESVWVNLTVSPLWKPGASPGHTMVVVEDITQRKRMEEEMREMSLRDLLTELYNRRGFITLAEQQIKAANRTQRPLQLTFIDLDRLKWINDTLGHEKGDKVLIDTAQLLRQTFRESDIIARLGGDEFAVLSIDTGDMTGEDFSRRLQQHIDAYNSKESRLYKLSMSWGTVIYHPDSSVTLDQLISAADELMYTQKKAKSSRWD